MVDIKTCIAENTPLSGGYRDFEGYKGQYPDPQWPGGAKLAVNFILNYEEGGEYSAGNGDSHSESMLLEMSNPPIRHGGRNLPVESQYEYGTRCGVWRVARLFKEKDVKITVYAVGQSILKSPDAAKRLVDDGHEFMSHGYRWIDHYALPLAVEKKQIEAGIEAIQKTTGGKAPLGWYYGRQSSSSKGLVCQVYKERGLEMLYQCDSYNDEMPYWEKHPLDAGKGLLIIPHTYDINDVQYANSPGFANPRDWLEYAKLAFDEMYAEGVNGEPKLFSCSLHSRLVGKPARIWALRELINHIQSHEGVWIATREEIARHWMKVHPFDASKLNSEREHFL